MKATTNFPEVLNLEQSNYLAHKNNDQKNNFWSSFYRLLAATLNAMAGSSEPKIQQRRDRIGQTIWFVYDPVSGQNSRFTSESEVRAWLDERYNHLSR